MRKLFALLMLFLGACLSAKDGYNTELLEVMAPVVILLFIVIVIVTPSKRESHSSIFMGIKMLFMKK